MFRSLKDLGYNGKAGLNRRDLYEITDYDFVVVVESPDVEGVAVAKEYVRRKLPLAKNMALYALYQQQTYGFKMKDILSWQNKYCSKCIINWPQIAGERDRLLNKLSAMK